MTTKQVLTIALLVFGLSVWIGLQIGLERSWVAGMFLFVVPTAVLVLGVSQLRAVKESPAHEIADELKAIRQEIKKLQSLPATIAEVRERLAHIEQKLPSHERAGAREDSFKEERYEK